jgi:hypothetical protein
MHTGSAGSHKLSYRHSASSIAYQYMNVNIFHFTVPLVSTTMEVTQCLGNRNEMESPLLVNSIERSSGHSDDMQYAFYMVVASAVLFHSTTEATKTDRPSIRFATQGYRG